jgi:lipopolysaccharide export system protein LptC
MIRRSRTLALLKYGLPTIALVMVFLVAVWPQLQPRVDRFRMGLAALQEGPGNQPTLINARYEGVDLKGRPFLITADEVVNLSDDDDRVALRAPHADLTLTQGGWLSLTAMNGIYDKNAERLELSDDVNLLHDGGHRLATSRATIDLVNGSASGTQPVEGQSPFGDLRGEGFRVIDEGRTVHLDGRSRMLIYPSALPDQK